MKRDDLVRRDALDTLLARWHEWQMNDQCSRGYAKTSAGFGQYRVSRQYDDSNGALDASLDARRSAQVDFEVRQLDEPYRTAIYVDARNVWAGVSVWSSPRLPSDREELEEVVEAARLQFSERLAAAGVLTA